MSEYVFRYAPGFGFDMDDQMETLPMTAREYYASNCADHYGTLHEEIVRCMDCRNYHPDEGTLMRCRFKIDGFVQWRNAEPDGFCSWAERREQ